MYERAKEVYGAKNVEMIFSPTKKKKNTILSVSYFILGFELTAQPQSNKFVVESKKPLPSQDNQVEQQTSIDWPFKMVCEHLCMDLFDPTWEIRHGAGIGLRSILKAHGAGAGRRGMHVYNNFLMRGISNNKHITYGYACVCVPFFILFI